MQSFHFPLDVFTARWLYAEDLSGGGQVAWWVSRPVTQVLLWLLLGAVVYARRGSRSLKLLCLSAALSWAVVEPLAARMLKPAIARVRPCDEVPSVLVGPCLDANSGTPSMPSVHAANAGLYIGVLGALFNWPGALVGLVLAAAIAWSRVALGVHWLSDVVFGTMLGAGLSYWLTRLLAHRLPPAARH